MASAMQLYGAFALLVIVIVAVIAFAAIVTNLVAAVRRRFGGSGRSAKARAHDDFSAPAAPSPKDPPLLSQTRRGERATRAPSGNPPLGWRAASAGGAPFAP